MEASLDPVVAHATASALAAVFLLAGIGKLRDPLNFQAAVEAYELLPAAAVRVIGWLLPLAELSAGGLLLMTGTRGAGTVLALALLLLFCAAITANLLRGRAGIDCGCGWGPAIAVGPGLLLRNCVLVLTALLLLLPMSSRETVWLDMLAALFLAVFLFGLNTLATTMLAQHGRLLSLRNHP